MLKTRYQLWCYYETANEWKMHDFFDSKEDADNYALKLREDVETPCMPVWEVVKVEVFYP